MSQRARPRRPRLSQQSGQKATQFQLANGMKVVVIEDHRAPVVTHMVWFGVGGMDDPPALSGAAHFFEHLMFKGTKNDAQRRTVQDVARNGGQDNAFTTHDYTAYFQRIAKERLALMMELEADRMVNLDLSEANVLHRTRRGARGAPPARRIRSPVARQRADGSGVASVPSLRPPRDGLDGEISTMTRARRSISTSHITRPTTRR